MSRACLIFLGRFFMMNKKRNRLWIAALLVLGIAAAARAQNLWNGAMMSPVAATTPCTAGQFDFTVACNTVQYVIFGP